MELASPSTSHPLLRCAEEIGAALDAVAEVQPHFMSVPAKKAALLELSELGERLRGLLLKVLAASDDVAIEDGARSAAAWLAHHTRSDHGPTARAGRLADALGARWEGVLDAVLAGRVSEDQAHVIVRALDALPQDLDPDLLARAQAHLVSEAAHFTPRQLRILGCHVLEVVAPDEFDDEARKQLEAEEREARRRTLLTLRTRGDGVTDILIRVPDSVAARLHVYLEAFTSPRRDRSAGGADADAASERATHAERLGQAFCALLEAMPAEVLPLHGGSATSVIVNFDFDQLLSAAGVARLPTGDVISAGEARRLLCNAAILPAVFGGKSEPLDLGRARRLYDTGQRKLMAIRDQQCRAEGCTIPAAWCEAHHAGKPWAQGGKTDLADGLLLCPFHHHRAHDDGYDQRRLPSGDLRFNRRR